MPNSAALASLHQLLQTDALQSHYQAIIDLRSGRPYGYEALIRPPRDGLLDTPPKLFAAAAQADLTSELDLHCSRSHIRGFSSAESQQRLFINLCPVAISSGRLDCRTLLAFIEQAGLASNQLVIEITEHAPIADYAGLRGTLDAFRQAGLEIAIDDLGSGYSGLRQWSELQPQYVKIDSHFVQGVHNCPTKRQFIHSIVEIARTLGSRVVAEGIETREELDTVTELGVHYGQGYLLARPAADIAPVDVGHWLRNTRPRAARTTQTVNSILSHTPSLPPDIPVSQVMELFDRNASLRCLGICQDGKPLGMVSRGQLTSLFASLYGRDLYSRRPVNSVMQTRLATASARTPLDELSTRLAAEYDYLPEQDLVVTDDDGLYLGTASFTDLLKAITELQIRSARYANPLTQLPGSVPINERIDELLQEGECFQVAYCDLDNFKPFNDSYGYARGDEVIRRLGQILQEESAAQDLVGHVGGDDFILVLRSEDWQQRCSRMMERFETCVPDFYDPEHRELGGIRAVNRLGERLFQPFLSVSIGIATARPQQHSSHMEVSAAAAEVKQQAKRHSGNCLFVDRRGVDEGMQCLCA